MTRSFRYAVTAANVARGKQAKADLDSIARKGVVESPSVSLYRELAVEYARVIDTSPIRRKRQEP